MITTHTPSLSRNDQTRTVFIRGVNVVVRGIGGRWTWRPAASCRSFGPFPSEAACLESCARLVDALGYAEALPPRELSRTPRLVAAYNQADVRQVRRCDE